MEITRLTPARIVRRKAVHTVLNTVPRVKSTSTHRKLPLPLVIGLMMASIIVGMAVFAEVLSPYDMAAINPAETLQAPSITHPFGTDLFGRDLLTRVMMGSRLSLMVAVVAVAIGAIPGLFLGMIAGMFPCLLTDILSYLMDAWLVLPGLLLAIALSAVFGRTTVVLAVALGIAGVPTYYRQARAETLKVRNLLFVESAHSMGGTSLHILKSHILPNTLPTLLVLITIRAGGMLLAVSAFSFIGLGAQPPEPEWGTLLADGRNYMQQAWWLTFFPGLAIAITVFSFNLIGDGLRDLLDPGAATR